MTYGIDADLASMYVDHSWRCARSERECSPLFVLKKAQVSLAELKEVLQHLASHPEMTSSTLDAAAKPKDMWCCQSWDGQPESPL